jgi:hypothetical protein
MFKLEDRKKVREHLRKVNAGQIKDPVAQYGTDANGDVIGDDGKPVPGTAAKGQSPAPEPETEPVDYTKMTTHADLDAALGDRTKPEGWGDMKVAEKQAWLAGQTNGGGW